MAPRRRRLAALLVALCLGSTALPACTPSEPPPSWTRVDRLPPTFRPETLGTDQDRLIVAGRSADPDRPTLLITEAETVREIRLTPESGYGRTATLSSVATSGDRVYAIGGDRGGAHGNVRWSVWSGNTDALAEHEQEFWTFGGQDAGSLTAIVVGPSGPMIIGNWGSPHGLDITVWTARGEVWSRQDSAGSALASTTGELLTERAAAVAGDRVIIAGTALDLSRGLVPRAAAWTQDAGSAEWQRADLPSNEPGLPSDKPGTSSALDLACAADCLIAGVVDGRVAAWTGDGTAWRALAPTGLAADDKTVTLRAFRVDAGWRIAVGAAAAVTIIDPVDGRSVAGPAGTLIDAAGLGRTAEVLIEDHDGKRSIWRADLTA